jgi:hypothetical protein
VVNMVVYPVVHEVPDQQGLELGARRRSEDCPWRRVFLHEMEFHMTHDGD